MIGSGRNGLTVAVTLARAGFREDAAPELLTGVAARASGRILSPGTAAAGFVLVVCCQSAAQLARCNANAVGGDISSGAMTHAQMLARPVLFAEPCGWYAV